MSETLTCEDVDCPCVEEQWCWASNHDDEQLFGPFSTRELALRVAEQEIAEHYADTGGTPHLCQLRLGVAQYADASRYLGKAFDANELIERLEEQARDDAWGHYEGDPLFWASDTAKAKLRQS